ncbi:MAG TPA: hypothetical protein VGA04_30060 [Streptosporangiaceae bacterium]
MRRAARVGWGLSAPAIEMLDTAADADERAAEDDRDRLARLRAMAAALGVLRAVPRHM